jgi:hypothetical protein
MTELLAEGVMAPLVALTLPAIWIWIREGRQQRGRAHERRRRLIEARDDVVFLDAWLRIHREVAPKEDHDQVRIQTRQDLERVYSAFAEASIPLPSEGEPITLGRVVGTALLVGRAERTAAKVARALYWLALAWAVLWAAAGTSVTLEEESSPGGWIAAVLVVVLFGVLPAWGVRAWATWLDRPSVRRPQPLPPPTRWRTPESPDMPPPPPPPPTSSTAVHAPARPEG